MFTRFHLACSVRLSRQRNHSFDCNVSQRIVLGPLGAGFQMFPAKALSAQGASLCCVSHPTLLVNVLFYILFPKSYIHSMSDLFKCKVLIFSFCRLLSANVRHIVYITSTVQQSRHSSRSTSYISFRCHRDRDRWDKSSSPYER